MAVNTFHIVNMDHKTCLVNHFHATWKCEHSILQNPIVGPLNNIKVDGRSPLLTFNAFFYCKTTSAEMWLFLYIFESMSRKGAGEKGKILTDGT